MSSNLPKQSYFDTQREWKNAYIDFIDRQRFTHAITLSWNRTVGLDRARADLKRLMAFVDGKLVSRRFDIYPSEKRTEALFVFEGMGWNHVHVHSVWRAPPGKWLGLTRLFSERERVWNRVVSTGSFDIVLANPVGGNREIAGYVLKGQGKNSCTMQTVWASDFHPSL